MDITFEPFRMPLKLSSGPIRGCDFASVRVAVENRQGVAAEGRGGIFLSDLWCFPETEIPHEGKTACMKEMVRSFAEALRELDGYQDPFRICFLMDRQMQQLLRKTAEKHQLNRELPLLLGAVCWSPFDAAIHDAWGRAAGRSCYDMYDRHFLNDDLSLFLGESWREVYPEDFLSSASPKRSILVQHVVGVGDPLTEQEVSAANDPGDGLPVSLSEWIEREGVRRLKIKLKGKQAAEDAALIREVYHAAAKQLEQMGIAAEELKLSLDPNEAYPSSELAEELLLLVKEQDPACFRAVEYMEQPVPRHVQGISMQRIAALKPVILDESLDEMHKLEECERSGWSGIALKTCKGHTHAIVSYCWAKRHGKFVAVQDLTNAGIAFVHSAHLWSRLALSTDSLEYNSRQYTPFSFPEVKETYPELFQVKNGRISIRSLAGIGLY